MATAKIQHKNTMKTRETIAHENGTDGIVFVFHKGTTEEEIARQWGFLERMECSGETEREQVIEYFNRLIKSVAELGDNEFVAINVDGDIETKNITTCRCCGDSKLVEKED